LTITHEELTEDEIKKEINACPTAFGEGMALLAQSRFITLEKLREETAKDKIYNYNEMLLGLKKEAIVGVYAQQLPESEQSTKFASVNLASKIDAIYRQKILKSDFNIDVSIYLLDHMQGLSPYSLLEQANDITLLFSNAQIFDECSKFLEPKVSDWIKSQWQELITHTKSGNEYSSLSSLDVRENQIDAEDTKAEEISSSSTTSISMMVLDGKVDDLIYIATQLYTFYNYYKNEVEKVNYIHQITEAQGLERNFQLQLDNAVKQAKRMEELYNNYLVQFNENLKQFNEETRKKIVQIFKTVTEITPYSDEAYDKFKKEFTSRISICLNPRDNEENTQIEKNPLSNAYENVSNTITHSSNEDTVPEPIEEKQQDLVNTLKNYIKKRTAETEEYFTFFCIKGGYSRTEKLNAANRLIVAVQNNGTISPEEMTVCRQGRLGKMISQWEKKNSSSVLEYDPTLRPLR